MSKWMWIAGQMLEVVLAKPQTEKKFDAAAGPHNAMPHPNYIPHPGYGAFPVNPYGHLSAGYGAAAGFQQVISVYIMLSSLILHIVIDHIHLIDYYSLAAYDIRQRTDASRYADGANGST